MIRVGISHCLLGAPVRFDGGHKHSRFCTESLAQFFTFEPLCPEVGIGMGTPRRTLRLVGSAENPRAVFGHDESQDFTDELASYADINADRLANMAGYIFCKGSPSCGIERVKVYNSKGHAQRDGVGIFAAKVKQLQPNLPVEEDGRLNDPLLRDSFIKRVFIYHEWKQLVEQGVTPALIQKFHARHKLSLLSHCQKTYRFLGPLVAKINAKNIEAESSRYIEHLMNGFKKVATRKNNTNVLMHLQGYLKHNLSSQDRQELAQVILEYRQGVLPLMSPLTLLKHHFAHHKDPYVEQQSFLHPYPKELAIRVVVQ